MNSIRDGFKDFLNTLKRPDLWFYLSLFDIRLKYRRSYIGPWWETISSGLIIATLGVLWSKIFQMDISIYLPYFAVGFIVWSFIASQINESCEIFYFHQSIILNIEIPYNSFILRLAFKNLFVLFHSILLLIPIVIYSVGIKFIYLFSFFGLFLLFLNITFLSLIVAIFCLRFHDTKYAVSNIIQVLFFATPIVWMPGLLRGKSWLLEFNPFYHWINVIRDPIMSSSIPIFSLIIAIATILLFSILSFYLLGRVKRRIPFWY